MTHTHYGAVFCILQLGVLLFNIRLFKGLLNPALLNAGVWFVILCIHVFVDHGLYPLSVYTFFIILLSSILFSLGVFVALNRRQIQPSSPGINTGTLIVPKLYLLLALFLAYPYWLKAHELAGHSTTGIFLMDLRTALTNPDFGGSFGILGYAVPVSFAVTFLFVSDHRVRLRSSLFMSSVMLSTYYAFLSTGRTFFFLLIISSVSIVYFRRREQFGVRTIVFAAAALAGVFYTIGSILLKLGSANYLTTLQVVYIYLLSGLSAFSLKLTAAIDYTMGAHTFRFFFAVLGKLGLGSGPSDLVREFVFVPYPTNVYSVFWPYYEDLGLVFVFLVQFVLGLFLGHLYLKATSGNRRYVIFYSLATYPLLLQWFQDQFASLTSTWIFFYILITLAFTRWGKRPLNSRAAM